MTAQTLKEYANAQYASNEGTTGTSNYYQAYYQAYRPWHFGGGCPSCGYCQHCGRGWHYTRPYHNEPYFTWSTLPMQDIGVPPVSVFTTGQHSIV